MCLKNFQYSIEKKINTKEVQAYAKECLDACLNLDFSGEMIIQIGRVYDKIKQFTDDGYRLYAEINVDLTGVLGHDQCNGSADITLVKINNGIVNHVVLLDLKYGIIKVSPFENKQLTLYMAGIIARLASRYHVTDSTRFTMAISQPRLDNIYEIYEASA